MAAGDRFCRLGLMAQIVLEGEITGFMPRANRRTGERQSAKLANDAVPSGEEMGQRSPRFIHVQNFYSLERAAD